MGATTASPDEGQTGPPLPEEEPAAGDQRPPVRQGGNKYACFRCKKLTRHRELEPSIREADIMCQDANELDYQKRFYNICLPCEVDARIMAEQNPRKNEFYVTDVGRETLTKIALAKRVEMSCKKRVKNAFLFAKAHTEAATKLKEGGGAGNDDLPAQKKQAHPWHLRGGPVRERRSKTPTASSSPHAKSRVSSINLSTSTALR